ncbi:MAG: CRTAC1 family protein [bacterium]|nr:CRTAC1 family protein [bacterium]
MLARPVLDTALSTCLLLLAMPAAAQWTFVDVTVAAGLTYEHGYVDGLTERRGIVGGVAAGDYDNDGLVDLYAIRGDIGPNLLFRNMGDGTFEEVGAAAGVDLTGQVGSGPLFADFDGDGRLDLFVGEVEDAPLTVFRNLGDGTFEDDTARSQIASQIQTFSASAGDYDLDGDLDLFLTFWNSDILAGFLWRNRGDGVFDDVSDAVLPMDDLDLTFTGNFTDVDDDGWPDLLVASDFGNSQVLMNRQASFFESVTTPVISDENGMGASVGDYDNDGDLDWFVTSIWDPDGDPEGNWGITGNRLYRNDGGGAFSDVTDVAGVRHGYWGWGSCFADFDNDGHLDIFHVNGFTNPFAEEFHEDPSRLYVGSGDGTFTEQSVARGIDDTGQGRGVVCFDMERDGDVDILVANNSQAPRLFRNDGGNDQHFLGVRLSGPGTNSQGIGAKVRVTAGGVTQLREIRAGSNYVSQDPAEAHFGLGAAATVDQLEVEWPGGETTVLGPLASDQILTVAAPLFEDGFESGDTSGWS